MQQGLCVSDREFLDEYLDDSECEVPNLVVFVLDGFNDACQYPLDISLELGVQDLRDVNEHTDVALLDIVPLVHRVLKDFR